MVGRTRGFPRRKTDFDVTDLTFLKNKNTELAKALADSQAAHNHILEERNFFHKELFEATLQITKLQNYISNIDASTRASLNCVVALSNHTTDILKFINYSKRLSNIQPALNHFQQSPDRSRRSYGSPNKTQAVKPMIDGHVIFRPTINLRRVNEIPLAEVQRLRAEENLPVEVERNYEFAESDSSNSSPTNESFQRHASSSRISFRHTSEGLSMEEVNNDHVNSNEELEDYSAEIQLDVGNGRLETVEEDDGELDNTITLNNRRSSSSSNRSITIPRASNSQLPLLSGVFRDVRVYLSPVDPNSNIRKTRGSGRSYKIQRSSESQCGKLTDRPTTSRNSSQTSTGHEQTNNSSPFVTFTADSTPIQSIHSSTFKEISNTSDDDSDYANNNDEQKKPKQSKRRHTEYHCIPKKLSFTRPSQPTNINNNLVGNTGYDPLEGPSNLLDTAQNETNKEDTLAKLGLIRTSHQTSSAKQPSSPAATVLRKRKSKLSIADVKSPNKHVTKRKLKLSPEQLCSTAATVIRKRKSKLSIADNNSPNKFVTKRKLKDTKRSSILSSKVAKVVLSRVSRSSNARRSVSPLKNTKRRKSIHSPEIKTENLVVVIKKSPSSTKSSPSSPIRSLQIKKSPNRKERRKRSTRVTSMKEPSLRKKLRRS